MHILCRSSNKRPICSEHIEFIFCRVDLRAVPSHVNIQRTSSKNVNRFPTMQAWLIVSYLFTHLNVYFYHNTSGSFLSTSCLLLMPFGNSVLAHSDLPFLSISSSLTNSFRLPLGTWRNVLKISGPPTHNLLSGRRQTSVCAVDSAFYVGAVVWGCIMYQRPGLHNLEISCCIIAIQSRVELTTLVGKHVIFIDMIWSSRRRRSSNKFELGSFLMK